MGTVCAWVQLIPMLASFRTGIEGGAILVIKRIDRGHHHHSYAQNKKRFKKKLKQVKGSFATSERIFYNAQKPSEQIPSKLGNGSKKRGSKENRKQNSVLSIIPVYCQVSTANV